MLLLKPVASVSRTQEAPNEGITVTWPALESHSFQAPVSNLQSCIAISIAQTFNFIRTGSRSDNSTSPVVLNCSACFYTHLNKMKTTETHLGQFPKQIQFLPHSSPSHHTGFQGHTVLVINCCISHCHLQGLTTSLGCFFNYRSPVSAHKGHHTMSAFHSIHWNWKEPRPV